MIIGIQIWSIPLVMAKITETINGVGQTYNPTSSDQAWCQQKFGKSCEKAYADSDVSLDDIKSPPDAPVAPKPAEPTGDVASPGLSFTQPKTDDKASGSSLGLNIPGSDVSSLPDIPHVEGVKLNTPEFGSSLSPKQSGLTLDSTKKDDGALGGLTLKGDEEVEDMTPEQLKANQEAQCKAMGYASCDAYQKANDAELEKQQQSPVRKYKEKLNSGQDYKFNLDSFSIKQKNGATSGTSLFNGSYAQKYGVLMGTLLRVIDILIYVIGSLALVTLVVAGLYMMVNHGDESYVTRGKDMMLYAILGLLVALLAYAIVAVIESALG